MIVRKVHDDWFGLFEEVGFACDNCGEEPKGAVWININEHVKEILKNQRQKNKGHL